MKQMMEMNRQYFWKGIINYADTVQDFRIFWLFYVKFCHALLMKR